MSRGMGLIERRLLAILKEPGETNLCQWEKTSGKYNTFWLAAEVYGIQPDQNSFRCVSEAQVSSVRRALNKLARQGVVIDCGRGWRDGRRRWALGDQSGQSDQCSPMHSRSIKIESGAFRRD